MRSYFFKIYLVKRTASNTEDLDFLVPNVLAVADFLSGVPHQYTSRLELSSQPPPL
jgi:hypothetical protein